jgi:hypothetical protein
MNPSVVAIIVSKINDHLMYSDREFPHGPVSHITCRDGTQISVQASKYHYCKPRDNQGPWTHVEVILISEVEPIHFEYPEDDVAAYIPIELVAQEILSHGNMMIENK